MSDLRRCIRLAREAQFAFDQDPDRADADAFVAAATAVPFNELEDAVAPWLAALEGTDDEGATGTLSQPVLATAAFPLAAEEVREVLAPLPGARRDDFLIAAELVAEVAAELHRATAE